jgi:V8-like Glu-specific endopeptidase
MAATEASGDHFDHAATELPPPHPGQEAFVQGLAGGAGRGPVGEQDRFRLAVAKIWCFAPGGGEPVAAGSGVFVAHDTLLTVGHVIFDPEEYGTARAGGYVGHVQIDSPWFPIPPAAAATDRVVAPPGWTGPERRRDGDIGVIKLNAPIPGVTPLIPQAHTDQQLANAQVAVYGFPALTRQLFLAPGRCVGLEPSFIYYDADVSEGESGGPLLAALPGGVELAGLHRAGPGETPSTMPTNAVSALRLTAEAIGWIQAMLAKL